ncbi:MAG TPA: response regulator [Longimicrobium sp.]|nr:response regulator [Longimicrobium sp.]
MAKLRVLLVEDDSDNRELLAEVLQDQYEVLTAPDGPSGLQLFLDLRPDVVVTDEALPGLRGTELARRIKAQTPAARVILVSGYAHPPGTEYCDAVLRKPLDIAELMKAVGEARPEGEPTMTW